MGFLDGEPSDLNPADIIAIALILLSLGIALVGADRDNTSLMMIAAGVSIPGGVLKVMSTRVKSKRWQRGQRGRNEESGGAP